MAKLSTEELLDAFKEMTLLELSEFVKQFARRPSCELPQGRKAARVNGLWRNNTDGPEEEGRRADQAADPGWTGKPRPAGRSCARPARRQHHGVLQGVQRRDRVAARKRHPRGDHRLRGPQLHFRPEDPARRQAAAQGRWCAEGLGRAAQDQGCQGDLGSGARDRRDQEADLNANDIDAAAKIIAGTARSMGITVE